MLESNLFHKVAVLEIGLRKNADQQEVAACVRSSFALAMNLVLSAAFVSVGFA
jgi:hypothetical protein